MEKTNNDNKLLPSGLRLAAIHHFEASTPLSICLVVQKQGAAPEELILLQEQADSKSYCGVIADFEGRIHDFVDISVQNLQLGNVQHAAREYQITNNFLDGEWRTQGELIRKNPNHQLIATRFELVNPPPLQIKRPPQAQGGIFWETEFLPWVLCKDDELLEKHGLPRYSTTQFRYLHNPKEATTKTFISTDDDNPLNPQTLSWNKFMADIGNPVLFNPHSGLIRITRRSPLDLETVLQIVEGKPWKESPALENVLELSEDLNTLRNWSHNPKGLPFRLYNPDQAALHFHESLFIKLSLLLSAVREVRDYVKSHQLPLLNLAPNSFGVSMSADGSNFPRLWSARCRLIRPGQAFPLAIKSTEQRYFVRMGTIKPSPYAPEGVGAHSFGIGRIQIRSLSEELDGVVLEGTLVADDYLGLDLHDLLWFKLPLGDASMEFHAHVFKAESRGPREARFRTVPTRFPEPIVAKLKESAGIHFPKSPYEIWPLLSSPCDLFSIGVIAVRLLLCNGESNLPAILDEVLSLARRVGESEKSSAPLSGLVRKLSTDEPAVREMLYSSFLKPNNLKSTLASQIVSEDIWIRIICLLLKLFPGAGFHAYCKSFGDVSPLALETVFDQPIQELELNASLVRSLLTSNIFENEEIANVILGHLSQASVN